jgi:hypothetical protein
MGRKLDPRPPTQSPAALEVPWGVLEPFYAQQAAGAAYYGEGLLPPGERVYCALHSPALAYAQAVAGAPAFQAK